MPKLAPLALASMLLACGDRSAPAEDTACLGPPRPEQPLRCFEACAHDSDCVTVPSPDLCSCTPWVVAREFQAIVEEKARREVEPPQRLDSGAYLGCGCWTCTGKPACVAGSCSYRYQCTRGPDASP